MTSPKICLALAFAFPFTFAHGAANHHAEASAPNESTAPMIAMLAEPSLPVLSVTPAGEHAQPLSAGTVESLPDMPVAAIAPLRFSPADEQKAARSPRKPSRMGVENAALPDEPGMLRLVQASPIGGVARRMQAQRFNTDDGVSANDFAICYRLNNHSSVQVIPGDPAPVKIPVSSFANNAGVTVGMVVRLSRQH